MSKGIPTIGFKTCTGTNELIKHEHNGLLIDDGVKNLAQALIKLMNDADLRVELGNQAHLDMKEYEPKKYGILGKSSVSQWFTVMLLILKANTGKN